MSKKVVFQRDTIDADTGELINTVRVIKRSVTNESFIRAYVEDICKIVKCTGAEMAVILCSLKYIDYNTNEFHINKNRRNEITELAGITKNTFNCCMYKLYKKNIFIKHENGNIYLNPRLFFFGSDVERSKILKLTIMYEIKD